MDMDLDSLPLERTLGIQWCIESDCFQFTIVLQNKPCTRRGILSTVSSIFDPLGFVAPLLLEGKSILQELCCQDLGWDDPIPDDIKIRWERWKGELTQLRCVSIPRCYKPEGFGRVIRTELHHFSDASVRGYGQCSYLRMMDEDGQIHCTFVMGKSRVTPLKPVTIPRLELTAAVCSARISQQILRELEYKIDENYYWTDSKVVLGYISNESRRFHVFVSNRVQEIQEITSSSQWRYVESKDNPADEASRGMKARDLHDSRWILGPEFLWHSDDVWPDDEMQDFKIGSQSDDPEVKKSVVMATRVEPVQQSDIDIRVQRFSSWSQAKRAVALARKYVQVLRDRAHKKPSREIPVNVDDLEVASKQIIRAVQARAFEDELQTLKPESLLDEVSRLKPLKMNSSIAKLDPFIDKDGIVRVGGRLHQANLSNDIKHPILLPKKSHVTTLIVRHFHERASHQGRSITLGEIRSSGFWIIGGSSLVSGVIASCTKCRKLRGSVTEQKMCDLPEDRLEPCPPFTYCAVDYFGPFIIKERRSELKRYGVLFTCMSSRAIHLETSVSLETDSFLNALRRFLRRRGPVRQLRSDQGTNFVGARRELKEALSEMDSSRVKNELLKEQCDWIDFKMNVPGASHMGGVWERQIRTVRAVLSSLLLSNGSQLDDESLRTLMCEAESIVNSRPLIPNQLTDSGSLQPLTPNSLLTMKSKVLLPPPGKFEPADVFSRKRWRRVQHLANEFWSRWRKEFVLGLQERQKWTRVRQDLGIGDVVMVMDANIPRNSWQLARVTSVYPSSDGQVRKVQVILADHCLDARGRRTGPLRFLDRPVQKLVLVLPSYGVRKPKTQFRSSLHNVSDLFVMGGCLVLESLALLHWCENQGWGPLGITGISMGGFMASLAATNWHKPISLIPCLSWSTASSVFTRGVISGAIDWHTLQHQYFEDSVYENEIRHLLESPESGDAYWLGQHLVRDYPANLDEMDNFKDRFDADMVQKRSIKKLSQQNNLSESQSHSTLQYYSSDGIESDIHMNNRQQSLALNNIPKCMNSEQNNGIDLVYADSNGINAITNTYNNDNISLKESSSLESSSRPSVEVSSAGPVLSSKPPKSMKLKHKSSMVQREAMDFMRGVMDECTHLGNFSVPVDPELIIVVSARDDAYVPRDNVLSLEQLWPGSEMRYIDAGHIHSIAFRKDVFRKAIVDSFSKQVDKYLS